MDSKITFGELFKLIAPTTRICLYVDPDTGEDESMMYCGIVEGLNDRMIDAFQGFTVQRIWGGSEEDVFASKNYTTGEISIFYSNKVNIRIKDEAND